MWGKGGGLRNNTRRRGVAGGGELEGRGITPRRENARIGRLEAVVDLHSFLGVIFNADAFEVEAIHIRHAPGPDENGIDGDCPLLLPAAQVNNFFLAAALDMSDVAAEHQLESIPVESFL